MKCIAIDDEPLALAIIENFCDKIPFLDLVTTFSNGIEVVDFLQNDSVDLMFLDINMPHITGVELVRSMKNPPMVIFTTAYQDYAITGFELDAVDYLVKPFSFERFFKAVSKANDNLSLRQKSVQPPVGGGLDKYIMVKVDYSTVKVEIADISMVEGLKDYIKIYTHQKTFVTKSTMKNIEERLPSDLFMRVHKSFIINIEHIDSFENNQILLGKYNVPIGNQYKDLFLDFLRKFKL